jgi:uncharacterized protein
MRYLDTSLVVSLLTPEPATALAQQWLADHSAAGVHVSDWVTVEVSSALAIRRRRQDIDDDQMSFARQTYELLRASTLSSVPVRRSDFEQAATWTSRHELSLRAADALHIAVASNAELELITRDVVQAKAARGLGVSVTLLK